jgi:hypothetical protein
MEILEKEDWVGETSIFGNYIHIILNDNAKGEAEIEGNSDKQKFN